MLMQPLRSWTRRGALGAALLALVAGVPTALDAATSNPAGAATSAAPITIAYITSITGPGGSEDSTSPGAFKARLDMQNAEGGVNGHKLVPLIIDDQTSPSAIATAVQEADSKAFAIVSQSPLFFLAAKYPQQQGIPVTGSYSDGPEWGQQPYTNMFAADVGSLNPKYPVTTLAGNFLKQHGATVLGTYGYGISPSSSRAAIQTADSFKHAGGKVGVLNTSVPFGGVTFTSDALVAKQDHVDALAPEMDNNSNFALAEALQQSGVKLKAALFATGYQPSVINSPAWSALQGGYFYSLFRPWSLPDAATKQMQAAMEKYDGYSKTRLSLLQRIRGVVGRGPHGQGSPTGGSESHACERHQGVARGEVLQRQRPPAHHVGLRHRLRPRLEELCLDGQGQQDRLHAGLVAALLRHGHPGNGDRQRHFLGPPGHGVRE